MKNIGMYQKYNVVKLTNPFKKMNCLVLEFDDEFSRVGIRAFADAVALAGYIDLANDINLQLEITEFKDAT